ncbi:MAG: thiamine pyrophosphate-binding protein [Alphaproteobacteria bacterium]
MSESKTSNRRSGGQVLVRALEIHGVDLAFGIPGESYLAVLDALVDSDIRLIVSRHEGGAAMMADAYGKLTGKCGIAFVTRGPGATNAAHGVHIADQDSTPLILFVGQVGRTMIEREAFQEIDYRRMFSPMTKWVAQIDDPARIPEFVSHAFHTALSGRPGPVVLALPEDMLSEPSGAVDAGPHRIAGAGPTPAALSEMRAMLEKAERPFVIAGGGGWDEEASAALADFAAANALAVGCSFRCQSLIDNRHPSYAGHVGIGINPKLAGRIKAADLLIVVGARLGEMTTGGYTLIDNPKPRQKLVHIHAGAEELGRVYQADLPINAGAGAFLNACNSLDPVDSRRWAGETASAHQDYLDHCAPSVTPGSLQMGELVSWLREHTDDETIIANGAGNFAIWVNRFFEYRGFRTQLAPTSGSMGYGLPAAIAAKLIHPERQVVCFAGDGDFQMTANELATAAQYKLAIVVLIVNNGLYGTIRMHQEREYPGRPIATDLVNPDFVKLAQAHGGIGIRVTRTEEFPAAFEAAVKSQTLAVIELCTDPEAITPNTTLTDIRQAALAAAK